MSCEHMSCEHMSCEHLSCPMGICHGIHWLYIQVRPFSPTFNKGCHLIKRPDNQVCWTSVRLWIYVLHRFRFCSDAQLSLVKLSEAWDAICCSSSENLNLSLWLKPRLKLHPELPQCCEGPASPSSICGPDRSRYDRVRVTPACTLCTYYRHHISYIVISWPGSLLTWPPASLRP